MKIILVPTDFSSCAARAAKSAINIARMTGDKIHFLHFLAIPIDWIHLEHAESRIYPDINSELNDANRQLQDLVRDAEKQGVESAYTVSYNSDTSQIDDFIRDNGIGMIVMGSHGANGVKELFIGSNAQKIARLSSVPVLIVKNIPIETSVHNLYFVSDFEPEAMEPFNELVNISEQWGAKIHLLYINTPSYFADTWEINERMEAFLAAGGARIEKNTILNAYVFEEGLDRYSFENGGGVIVMATHGRKGISRMFYGSITERVVNHVEEPVLSLHMPLHKPVNQYVEKKLTFF